ncbi:hypothetical protein Sros01_67990 [Streptomyces roseochromogenus]|nr:hypothetical protein Sros01_67990 [Streptomyces roseochromogenus]
MAQCTACSGDRECRNCNGSGKVDGFPQEKNCPTCGGDGACSVCGGKGYTQGW